MSDCETQSEALNENPEQLVERARRLLAEDRLEESADACCRAIALSAECVDAWVQLGTTVSRSGRWGEAATHYEHAIELDDDHPAAHTLLADAYAKLELWQPAIAMYKAAVRLQPEDPALRAKLEKAQLQLGGHAVVELQEQGNEALAPLDEPRREEGFYGEIARRYLDLMKGCLTFMLWGAADGPILELSWRRPLHSLIFLWHRLLFLLGKTSRRVREAGLDWPASALTMVGLTRLGSLQSCVEDVLERKVPGDLIETGVWRGGASIFMRAILAAHGIRDRRVWVADSFNGLPVPDTDQYPADRKYNLSMWRSLAVPLDEVRANFARFQLLDDQVCFLPGWFKDSLPTAPIEKLAILRLDGDLYESTMDALKHLYPKLSPGGYAIIDDYYCSPPCRQAVETYRREHGITEEIVPVDTSSAYWRRT